MVSVMWTTAMGANNWRWMPVGIRRAFLLSVAFHIVLLLAAEVSLRMGWFEHRLVKKMFAVRMNEREAAAKTAQSMEDEDQKAIDVPLLFLDVDPSKASKDAPNKPAYYAAANTRAANPDTSKSTDRPMITGKQDKIVRTMDVVPTREKTAAQAAPTRTSTPTPLQPETPKAAASFKPAPEPTPRTPIAAKAETALRPGDLLMAKPAPDSTLVTGKGEARTAQPAPRERPRTLAQARAQTGRTDIAAEKSKQAGGVSRFGVETTLDAKATAYGAYDAAVIAAIQRAWYALLDERGFSLERSGKVVVDFRMKHDGSIHDLRVVTSEVGDLYSILCQKAIQDPSPFGAWPRQMRVELGDFRDVRFTFHYN